MTAGKRIIGIVILGLLCILAGANPAVASNVPHKVTVAAVTDPQGDGLFSEHGTATCVQCHNESPATDILKTPHAVKGDVHAPGGQKGCESCHGPSNAHAKGFAAGNPAGLSWPQKLRIICGITRE